MLRKGRFGTSVLEPRSGGKALFRNTEFLKPLLLEPQPQLRHHAIPECGIIRSKS